MGPRGAHAHRRAARHDPHDPDHRRLAPGFDPSNGSFVDATNDEDPSLGGAAGGIESNGRDLLRFIRRSRTARCCRRSRRQAMRAFVPGEDYSQFGVTHRYGLGFEEYSTDAVTVEGHMGTGAPGGVRRERPGQWHPGRRHAQRRQPRSASVHRDRGADRGQLTLTSPGLTPAVGRASSASHPRPLEADIGGLDGAGTAPGSVLILPVEVGVRDDVLG